MAESVKNIVVSINPLYHKTGMIKGGGMSATGHGVTGSHMAPLGPNPMSPTVFNWGGSFRKHV